MRSFPRVGLGVSLLLVCSARLPAQSTLSRAGPPLFILDVQGTPLDEFPNGVKALNGVMTTVDKNGQHMLMASSPSEFLITLPQVLPAAFTVIVDLIPKACCNPEDFMLEGTPARNRGVASVELTWHSSHIMAVGGGGEMYQSDTPDDLAASTPGNPTQLVFEFNGTTIKLYTNGRRLYTLDKQFARGRVLRVWLGGETATNPMYLAGLSVLSGAVASGVIAANTTGAPPGPNSSASAVTGTTSGSAGSITAAGFTTGSCSGCSTQPIRTSATPTGSPSATGVSSGIVSPPRTGVTGTSGASPLMPAPTGSGTQSQSQALTGSTPTVMRMGPTVTQGSAGPIVQWATLTGANGYTVKRWLSTDLTCCNNASSTLAGSPWQDQALLVSGTYVYEVTAIVTGGVPVVEQTQFTRMMPVSTSTPSLPAPLPTSNGGTSSTTTSSTATPVVSAPIAVQSGTPVRTASTPPPGSGATSGLVLGPATLSATPIGWGAELHWPEVVGGVEYQMERSITGQTFAAFGTIQTRYQPPQAGTFSIVDQSMPPGSTTFYRVRALLSDGTLTPYSPVARHDAPTQVPYVSNLTTLQVFSGPLSANGPVLVNGATGYRGIRWGWAEITGVDDATSYAIQIDTFARDATGALIPVSGGSKRTASSRNLYEDDFLVTSGNSVRFCISVVFPPSMTDPLQYAVCQMTAIP